MNQLDGLVEHLLEQPDDSPRALVLADWLEEHQETERAELFRLLVEWAGLEDEWKRNKLAARFKRILCSRPDLARPLKPLFRTGLPWMAEPAALTLFLTAGLISVADSVLVSGIPWEGELHQPPHSFPTVLTVRRREGNQFEGSMTQDFSSMFGTTVTGQFTFRGVVGRAHVAFVTYRMRGMAAGPGLYQFRLERFCRLEGTWRVGPSRGERMWLQLTKEA
jgi:uncharacterized protein (TIGR02996 family)